MSKPKVVRTAARLSIQSPGNMSSRERRDIAGWLRSYADRLMKGDQSMTDKRFTAAFNYTK